jgi:beta-glucosidase
VTVKNVGQRDGREAVLMFLSDDYASITPEVKMLRAFTKITLRAGQSQTVNFRITADDMSFIGRDDQPTLEAGSFTVRIGSLTASYQLKLN